MTDFRIIVPSPCYAKSRAFYEDVLQAIVVDTWFSDDDQPAGAVLRLTSGGCVELVDDRIAHDGLRIGVELDTPKAVDTMHSRLVNATVPIISEPIDRSWGHRNCTAVAPEGTMITFYAHIRNEQS
jgi:catechol 2,3-dioxygenase-like lactoylglutathione lyase family enzyme